MNTYRQVLDYLVRPRAPHTLAVIRIATGSMIAYIHVIWMLRLDAFMGPQALLSNEVLNNLHARMWKWTYLAYTDSMAIAWAHETVALLAGILMCVGFASRLTVPIACLLTLLTAHRLAPFLFGLDQVALMLAMYLCVGRSGDVWSIDAWRKGVDYRPARAWNNTLSMRLIQWHLCVIYLFGGISKLRGWMWWDGSAMWFAAAAYEYQSIPLTWIGYMPIVASMTTHATLLWEVSYSALVWPRATRPWMLAMAVLVHGGIALFLGMITFGWMMIVANLAFIEPETVAAVVRRCLGRADSDEAARGIQA